MRTARKAGREPRSRPFPRSLRPPCSRRGPYDHAAATECEDIVQDAFLRFPDRAAPARTPCQSLQGPSSPPSRPRPELPTACAKPLAGRGPRAYVWQMPAPSALAHQSPGPPWRPMTRLVFRASWSCWSALSPPCSAWCFRALRTPFESRFRGHRPRLASRDAVQALARKIFSPRPRPSAQERPVSRFRPARAPNHAALHVLVFLERLRGEEHGSAGVASSTNPTVVLHFDGGGRAIAPQAGDGRQPAGRFAPVSPHLDSPRKLPARRHRGKRSNALKRRAPALVGESRRPRTVVAIMIAHWMANASIRSFSICPIRTSLMRICARLAPASPV